MSPAFNRRALRWNTGVALAAAMLAGGLASAPVHAQASGVKTLLDQAQYWEGKGRHDLAVQAWRRALELDPANAVAKRALSPAAAPAPTPQPTRTLAAMPQPARAPAPRPVTPRAAPAPASASVVAEKPAPRPAAPAGPSAADRAGQSRVVGFRALQDNDLDSAEHQFQSALARNKRDADALGGLGLVDLKRGRFAQARDQLAQASQLGDASKWKEALESARYFASLQEAQAMVTRGALDDARKAAEALIRSGYAENGGAYELLADIYERQGRYADAADLYRQAGGEDTPNGQRLQSRAARGAALSAAARGDDFGAEQAFQQGIMLDQSDPWIRYEFARFMIRRGRVPESESLIASLASSTDPDALYAAAMLNSDLGRTAASQGLIDRIPDEARSAPMRNFAIGLKIDTAIIRAKQIGANGQKGEAVGVLKQLGGTKGLSPIKQAAIAEALLDLGDNFDAASMAQQAINGPVAEIAGYEAILRVAVRTGRDDLARTAMAKATQLAAGDPNGQRAVARMAASAAAQQADRLRQAGQFAQAFDVLQTAFNAAPDSPEILSSLARLYQSGKMNARAAQTFQMILVRDPKNRDALSGLMETAQAAGDKSLSQQAQAQLLRENANNYEVWLAAARTEQARGNASAATRYFKQAREVYQRSSGTNNGANPFASSPFAADGAQVAQQAPDANPFRAQQQQQQQPTAPAMPNPFTLGGGTRLQMSAPQQPSSFAPQNGAAQGGFSPQGNYGVQQVPAAYQGNNFTPQSAPAPATWGGLPGNGFAGGAQNNAAPFAATPQAPVDPVLAGIERDIAGLAADNGPRAEVNASFRARKGETGLSQLSEMKTNAQLSTGLGRGRVFARAEAVVIDAGRPTGSGLARFGTNATIEAQAIVNKVASALVNAETQRASGVALSAGYADKLVQVEGGTTPVGFGNTRATWRVAVTPQMSEHATARAWFERKPVTDSVVSYAGTRDPVTGQTWGQVMRTGGGVGYSYENNGNGAYGDVSYNRYNGTNVLSNRNVEVNVGGYMQAWRDEHSSITAGMNINYQSYANNQNQFTWGQGGYFSPQSFLALSFPIRYAYQKGNLDLKVAGTPGFQSFSQNRTDLYPGDPAAQATLNALKAANSDVRNYYDSLSKTGFGMSAQTSLYYRIGPATRVGGEVSYNTFGNYDEFRSMLGIRQSLGNTK
ncbi:cellulose synthase subunit BcsC-related outer membrane protein [Novosphingobium sediminicola]|uniref:Tetratricopeptide (TPR) repeat protein n=1 Tax=Novosphingobium sediminicola TaxID=563162 RepID=A0A7W6CF48_9SPHN|nr:tetratricopeptide (TPR) repeat protein [Novosphingobium sediminicola]